MPICLFGVCIPLNLVLPFCLGVLHRLGFVEPVVEWSRRLAARLRWRRQGEAASATATTTTTATTTPAATTTAPASAVRRRQPA